MTLNQLSIGDSAVITKINADKELKSRLNSFGLIKGNLVLVNELSLAKKTYGCVINGHKVALRYSEAAKIEVN
ncbi:MAG: ferrous iron transport protein A [Candidatus Marithrix sp.]|nr:ferrous iron transport protein A [Candidatus Marithrix sp.]